MSMKYWLTQFGVTALLWLASGYSLGRENWWFAAGTLPFAMLSTRHDAKWVMEYGEFKRKKAE